MQRNFLESSQSAKHRRCSHSVSSFSTIFMTTTTSITQTMDDVQQQISPACRFCRSVLQRTFVDLGMSPLCESYPAPTALNRGEVYYPLHTYVCEKCFLVQLEQYESPESIFS